MANDLYLHLAKKRRKFQRNCQLRRIRLDLMKNSLTARDVTIVSHSPAKKYYYYEPRNVALWESRGEARQLALSYRCLAGRGEFSSKCGANQTENTQQVFIQNLVSFSVILKHLMCLVTFAD